MDDATDHSLAHARIQARSKEQALDWSLVLTSQDIPSTLSRSEEHEGWFLFVDPADYERAVAAIRLYRLENRGWGWRQDLPWSGITFHWGALSWVIAISLFHALAAARENLLYLAGRMDSVAVLAGQWWRLFTAITLHADIGHLASNATSGGLLLGLAMGRFGAGWGLLAAYVAGALGNVMAMVFHASHHLSVGASGMVMGGLGLVAVHSINLWRKGLWASRVALSGLLTGLMLFILLGTDPASDVLAHLGGFLAGALLGTILGVLPSRWLLNTWSNGLTLLGLCSLVLWTWWLALR